MADRYYVEQPIPTHADATATLTGPEAHHLLHVMRAKLGDQVMVFDGGGGECLGEVIELGRSEVRLRVVERRAVDREATRRVTLVVALPKGDRQRWLVEKATELGAARLLPVVCERGVAQLNEKALARLRRTVVEASKQCGRNRLMEIAEPVDWATLIRSTIGMPGRLIAHPGGEAGALELPPEAEVICAIGPEGGFTPAEVDAAVAAGWTPIDLGRRILRVETAALAVLARLAQR